MVINQDPRFNDLTVPGGGASSEDAGFVWSDIIPSKWKGITHGTLNVVIGI